MTKPVKKSYPRLTVDPIVFSFEDNALKVLLYKRTTQPYDGLLALPGGDFYANEYALDAVTRSLKIKASVTFKDISFSEQLHFFDTKDLDSRGHAVSLSYLCTMPPIMHGKYKDSLFVDVATLPNLAYDHATIIKTAVDTLQKKLITTTIARYLLPESFSLNDLYRLYCAAFSIDFDNRNFRKKFLSFKVLLDTNKKEQGVAYRPSTLYAFKGNSIQNLSELSL